MQNDLISRSKLLEELEIAAGTAAPGQVQAAMLIRDKLAFTTEVVKQAEAVDAEPVRHGRWVDNTKLIHGFLDFQFNCSECDYVSWNPPNPVWLHYCPNCGAKMDGGADK